MNIHDTLSTAHGAGKAAQVTQLKNSSLAPSDRAQIAQLSEQFESVFLDIVMQSMRKTVPKSGFLDGGNAEEVFRSMLDSEYAKILATQRHTGIAEAIEKDLVKAMEIQSGVAQKQVGQEVYRSQSLRSGTNRATIKSGKN